MVRCSSCQDSCARYEGERVNGCQAGLLSVHIWWWQGLGNQRNSLQRSPTFHPARRQSSLLELQMAQSGKSAQSWAWAMCDISGALCRPWSQHVQAVWLQGRTCNSCSLHFSTFGIRVLCYKPWSVMDTKPVCCGSVLQVSHMFVSSCF